MALGGAEGMPVGEWRGGGGGGGGGAREERCTRLDTAVINTDPSHLSYLTTKFKIGSSSEKHNPTDSCHLFPLHLTNLTALQLRRCGAINTSKHQPLHYKVRCGGTPT